LFYDLRRKLIHIMLRRRFLFGGLFLCFLFRHAWILPELSKAIPVENQTDPLPGIPRACQRASTAGTVAGASRACRYNPDRNATYQEFAMHYDVGVVPGAPSSSERQGKVEVGVQVVERGLDFRPRRGRTSNGCGDLAYFRSVFRQGHLNV
jgi:hypothetical protein